MFWRHPRTSPLPYTTLFRSQLKAIRGALVAGCFFGQHQAICGMRPAGRSVFSTCNQLLESVFADGLQHGEDRKSTRLNSSHLGISYAVFCLKKKKNTKMRL